MAELQKLNLEKVTSDLGKSKIVQTVAAPAQAISDIVKPNKHLAIRGLLLVLVVAAGALSGWGVHLLTTRNKIVAGGSTRGGVAVTEGLKVGDIVGVDEKSGNFTDTAEGVLDKGGLNGEGSHKLLRPGGKSQTVYLTSSVIDLDQFIGHRVKIWGETFAGQKVGWLMDVGRVQVLELNAPTPEGN
jgi:hypothetical protein